MSRNLAEQLKKLRRLHGASLRDVQKATGISNAYLSQLERGKASNPSPAKLYRLAEYYDVPYESLMRAAGYIEKRTGAEKRKHPTALESKLMSLNLTPDEEEKLILFIEKFLRSGESNDS